MTNKKKGYKATYTQSCGLRQKNMMYKTLHESRTRIFLFVVAAAAAASCWLSLRHPMACEAHRHLAAMRKMTRNPGSRKQNQCAWSSLGGAWKSHSFSLLQGSNGSSLEDVSCCIHGGHPCASLEQLGSHRGIAIAEAWKTDRVPETHTVDLATSVCKLKGIKTR